MQTWHGTIAFKDAEAGIEKTLSSNYVKDAKNDGKITDLILSGSKSMTNLIKSKFWYDGPIEEIGLPQNDILFNCTDEIRKKVYDYYNIDYSKKIILYAPTYRLNGDEKNYMQNLDKCCNIIKTKFKDDFVVLIRLHPNDIEKSNKLSEKENIINATLYPDVQELLAVAHIGITDYSSISFDLAMLYKPVFLICKDYQEYISNERNLIIDINNLPYKVNTKESELYKSINDFSQEEYERKCKKFFEREDIKLIKTTTASHDVVQIIKNKLI